MVGSGRAVRTQNLQFNFEFIMYNNNNNNFVSDFAFRFAFRFCFGFDFGSAICRADATFFGGGGFDVLDKFFNYIQMNCVCSNEVKSRFIHSYYISTLHMAAMGGGGGDMCWSLSL